MAIYKLNDQWNDRNDPFLPPGPAPHADEALALEPARWWEMHNALISGC